MSSHERKVSERIDAQQRERLSVIAKDWHTKLEPSADRELLIRLLAKAYCCHPLSELRHEHGA
jgi:hypothetical protein